MSSFNKEAVLKSLTPDFLSESSPLKIGAMFYSKERQRFFKIFYDSMRLIDDSVDDIKEKNNGIVPLEQRKQLEILIDHQLQCLRNRQGDARQLELYKMIDLVGIPISPWERLAEAMKYDFSHNGFDTFADFLKYSEGAAVAPGSVAMFLCGMKYSDGKYSPPEYDIFDYARPLALFSYTIHVMRDFQKDQLKSLNYFSTDLVDKNLLNVERLRDCAEDGKVVDLNLKDLMKSYCNIARNYRKDSLYVLSALEGKIELRYFLSLKVLFRLYDQVLDRIESNRGTFTSEELEISPEDKLTKIKEVLAAF